MFVAEHPHSSESLIYTVRGSSVLCRNGLSSTLAASEVKAFTSYFRNSNDPGAAVPSATTAIAGFTGGVTASNFKLGPNTNDNTGHTEWCDGRIHHEGFTTVFRPNTVVNYYYSAPCS